MSKTFRHRRDDEEGIREKRQRAREDERTQRKRHMRPEDYLDMLKDEDADIQLSG